MIFLQLSQQLQSLKNLLASLKDEEYIHTIEHLGNASIGGHTRHIIELLQCAISGYHTGVVDYVNRYRNMQLEIDKSFAQTVIQQMDEDFRLPNKQLTMLVEEMELSTDDAVTTTYFREVVYNTEHTIHHLALIKVALIEMKLAIVDASFGMAYSTIRFKATINS
jgi:S-ribosylhomocysteine lyase LuxS involved in autoinducer biosynthesis